MNTELRSACRCHDDLLLQLKSDATCNESTDAGDCPRDCDTEDDPSRRREDGLTLLAPCPDVENRARCVEHGGEQHKFQTARIDQKHRVDDGDPGNDRVASPFLWTYVVGLAAPRDHETVGGHEQ